MMQMIPIRRQTRACASSAVAKSGCLCVLLLFALLSSQQATAQTGGAASPNAAPGAPAGSYSLSGFEQVNLFNGNLNFSLPLLGVGGRGGMNFPISLTVKNAQWKMDREGITSGAHDSSSPRDLTYRGGVHVITSPAMTVSTYQGIGYNIYQFANQFHFDETIIDLDGTRVDDVIPPQGIVYYHPNPNGWNGIDPGYGPGLLQARTLSRIGGTSLSPRLTRLTFTAPDGTEYELRDRLTGGLPDRSSNSPMARGHVFASADGTAMTFISDAAVTDDRVAMGAVRAPLEQNLWLFNPSGYLLFADGSRYRIDGGLVSWVRDRNGNLISFDYDANRRVVKITDSLNRVVTLWYEGMLNPDTGAAFDHDEIRYAGTGGQTRTLKLWHSDLRGALRSDYADVKSYGQLFGDYELDPNETGTAYNPPRVVKAVELPDARRYELRYDPYNQLARVVLPTGGAIEYDYGAALSSISFQLRVSERRLYKNAADAAPESRESYEVGYSNALAAPRTTTVTVKRKQGSDNKVLGEERHYFYGNSTSFQAGVYSPWNEGREFKTEALDPDHNEAVLRTVVNTWQQRPVNSSQEKWWTFGDGPPLDPRLVETVTTLENGLTARQTSIDPNDASHIGFDRYNNRTDLWEYDYKAEGEAWRLLRHTHTKYLTTNPINDLDYACDPDTTCNDGAVADNVIHIRSLPEEQWVNAEDGVNNKRSLSRFEYDNYAADAGNRHGSLVQRSDISGLCLTLSTSVGCVRQSDASYLTRGNLTATTNYLLSNTGAELGSVTANSQYDVAGNIVRVIDGRGSPTELTFDDNFGTPNDSARDLTAPSGLNGKHAFAFVTQTGNALGHVTRSQYDYNTGQVVNFEDANGTVTKLSYALNGLSDPLDRLRQVERAANYPDQAGQPNLRSQTTYGYDDASLKITTTSDLRDYGDNLLKSEVFYDGLGRTTESRRYENSTQYIRTLTHYDTLGKVSEVSNPYRPTSGESPVWTTTTYDALGRVSSLTTKADMAVVYTLYSGDRTLVTDQSGKQRLSKTDALGRQTDVWEVRSPDPASGTEVVSFSVPQGIPVSVVSTGYRTSYQYDVLSNLREVRQGGQSRYFAYDALGHLLRASNPEQEANVALALPANGLNSPSDNNNSWSQAYVYDENGNLSKRTDARGVETTYAYDALNRLTDKSYTNIELPQGKTISTPPVKYFYDAQALPPGAPSFIRGKSVGRLMAVIYGGGSSTTGSYTGEYDALGQAHYSAQVTTAPDAGWHPVAQPPYVFGYEYNRDGSPKSETYPSGRVVVSEFDAAGRLAGVKNATGSYYAGGDPSITNNPNVIGYTAHGAVAALRLGNGLWEHTLYNERLQPVEIGLGTTRADSSRLKLSYGYGQLVSGTPDPSKNNGNIRSQAISVPAEGTMPAQTFTQSYAYDALNRLEAADEAAGTAPTWQQGYAYDRYGNRRLKEEQTKSLNGAGQMVAVVADFNRASLNPAISSTTNRVSEASYGYDKAGNLLCDQQHPCAAQPTPTTYYDYDGEQRMVAAGDATQSVVGTYAYDGDGRRVRKVWGSQVTVFVYDAAGRLAGEYANQVEHNGTQYLTEDHLGSTRVVTGQSGSIISRHDYLPFGEEVGAGVGGRTTAQGYVGDNVSQKFTGKIRDTETGLDYFGTRYYASSQGRFVQADPLYIELHRLGDPQQLNLYAYGRNNPSKYTDPTGLDITCDDNRCNDYLNGLRKDVSFKIAYDKTGKVVTEGDIDKKHLSKSEKELLKAIGDEKHHVTIHAIDGGEDANVFFGRSDDKHKGSHTIAFGQAALLDDAENAGGMSSAQLIGHETLEGYAESHGNNLEDAHNYANEYFGGLDPQPKGATYGLLEGKVVQLTANFAVHGTSTTERITLHFITPIPQQDFLKGKGAPYPQYPVNVEAVKQK
jgi:RHS repeat-associated protein